MTSEPTRYLQGLGCRSRATKGGQTDPGNGGIHRHTEQGENTSCGGCQVASVGGVQVRQNDSGNGGRHRHADQGENMSGGGCQVASVGGVQVDGVPHQEKTWRVYKTESATTTNGY